MRQSTRLIVNTGATYGRMLVTFGLGLLYTRFALQGLGQEDLGLVFVAMASVLFITTPAESLLAASDRFLAVEVGRADPDEFRRVKATVKAMFFAIALATVVGGAGLAAWTWQMPGRVGPEKAGELALATLLLAFGAGASINGLAYRSTLTSHQNIVALTVLEFMDMVLRLGVAALTLADLGVAPMVVLTGGLMLVQGVQWLAIAGVARRLYPHARVSALNASGAVARRLAVFTAWSLVGGFAWRLRMQGPQVLMFNVFGTGANAAYGVAQQVAGYQHNLAQAVTRAVNPALVAAEARGDRATALRMLHALNKFGLLMMLFFVVPVSLEARTLLELWLTEPLPLAISFVPVLMAATALNASFVGYFIILQAVGELRGYMLVLAAGEVLAFAGAWAVAAWLGWPAERVMVLLLAGWTLTSGALVLHVCGRLGLPAREWLTRSLGPVLAGSLPAAGAAWAVHAWLDPGLVRVVLVGVVYGVVGLGGAWVVALTGEEREHFSRVFRGGLRRAGLGGSAPAPRA